MVRHDFACSGRITDCAVHLCVHTYGRETVSRARLSATSETCIFVRGAPEMKLSRIFASGQSSTVIICLSFAAYTYYSRLYASCDALPV